VRLAVHHAGYELVAAGMLIMVAGHEGNAGLQRPGALEPGRI